MTLFYSKEKQAFSSLSSWLFLFSGIFTGILFVASRTTIAVIISIVLSSLLSVYIFLIKKVQNMLLTEMNKKVFIFSLVATLFADIQFYKAFSSDLGGLIKMLGLNGESTGVTVLSIMVSLLLVLFSSIVICAFFYLTYTKLLSLFAKIYKTFDKKDKVTFLAIFGVFATFIIVSYSLTFVFWGTSQSYDVIYTSDTGVLFSTNCWLNIRDLENDLRQPLFGLVSAPFSVIPYAISTVLFFIPNLYAFLFAISQAAILILSLFLIVKLMNLGAEKILVYCIFISSFPSILFALNLEQYIFALFFLVLFVYANKLKVGNQEELFLASTGSLLTSAALFPLLYKRNLSVKKNALYFVNLALVFVSLCFIFGRGPYFIDIISKIQELLSFSGQGLSLFDRLKQYTVFICSCFVFPSTQIVENSIQQTAANSFNLFGIFIFVVATVSFFLNRKDSFAKISFAWICFSFVMLGVVGWGAKENGMVLYSLYFGWAFVSLLVLLVNKIPKKLITIKYVIYSAALLVLLFFNIQGIVEILKFGITYFKMV